MRIKNVVYKNQDALMIYVTADEDLDEKINNQIKELKKLYKKVAVFVSGRNSMEEVIKSMIQARR